MPIAYPYKMSDWYGYDKDCSAITTFYRTFAQSKSALACDKAIEIVAYHNGSGSLPAIGDTVYTNLAGTTPLTSGVYGASTATSGSPSDRFSCDSNGDVSSFLNC
jgi:hypothetical protein